MMYKKILIPLDGKLENEAALKPAVEMANAFRAGLIFFRAVPHPIHPPGRYSIADAEPWLIYQRRLKDEATKYLAGLADRPELKSVESEWAIGEGITHKVILKAIDQYQVDLVILTKKKRSQLARWVLGSTPQHIVRKSSIPVLLVRV
jgi:nucleotide-binding universal stress UspA family protein